MNSHPASREASAILGQERQTEALIERVALILCLSRTDFRRQKPTRIPYSNQAKLGTSGITCAPPGGGSTARGMGPWISHSSTLTMVHTTTRADFGRRSVGRSMTAE